LSLPVIGGLYRIEAELVRVDTTFVDSPGHLALREGFGINPGSDIADDGRGRRTGNFQDSRR